MATRDEITRFNTRFSEALFTGDFGAIGEMYDREAQFLMSGQPRVVGRDAIIQMMQERHKAGPTSITIASGDVFESGELVVDVGTYEIEGDPPLRGTELVVYRRNNAGELQLLVDVPLGAPSGVDG